MFLKNLNLNFLTSISKKKKDKIISRLFYLSFDPLETPYNLYFTHITPEEFLFLTTVIFTVGIFGLITNTESIIFSLVSMELIILSLSLNFTYFSIFFHEPKAQMFSLLLLGIAASEAAVGLSLLLVASKMKNSIRVIDFSSLRG